MTGSSVPRKLVASFPGFTIVALSLLAGCFVEPDAQVGKMICWTNDNCPVGYECVVADAAGRCQKSSKTSPDAGNDQRWSAEVRADAPMLDAAEARDQPELPQSGADGDGRVGTDGISPLADAPQTKDEADTVDSVPRGDGPPRSDGEAPCEDAMQPATADAAPRVDAEALADGKAPLADGPDLDAGADTADGDVQARADAEAFLADAPDVHDAADAPVNEPRSDGLPLHDGEVDAPPAADVPGDMPPVSDATVDLSPACLDPQSDPHNCGFCGHDCLGGQCQAGRCQPAIVAGNLDATAYVESVDGQYVYFSTCSTDFTSCRVWKIEKSALDGEPTLLTTGSYYAVGVIGPKLLLTSLALQSERECDLTAGCATYVSLPNGGALCSFKSPSPTYIAMWNVTIATWQVSWFATDHSFVASYSEQRPAGSTYRTAFATGDAVYWIRAVPVPGESANHALFGVRASDSTATELAGSLTESMNIVDANSRSVLLRDTQSIYRVPLGGAPALQQLASPAGYAVEDETGMYWMDDAGTVYRCVASDCAGTKIVLTESGANSSQPFQDGAALYWGGGSPNRVVRLAK